VKRAFFLFLIVFVVVASAAYLVWLVGQAVYDLWNDRKLYKEMAELEAWAKNRRQTAAAPPTASQPTEPASRHDTSLG
jgi:NADH:ubiquinone oxidoreductase subunit 4 (subunit M)